MNEPPQPQPSMSSPVCSLQLIDICSPASTGANSKQTNTACGCFQVSGGETGGQIKDLDFLQISVGHTEKFKKRKCSDKWAEKQPVTLGSGCGPASDRPSSTSPNTRTRKIHSSIISTDVGLKWKNN